MSKARGKQTKINETSSGISVTHHPNVEKQTIGLQDYTKSIAI